jgi:hypothetical protein
LSFHSLLHETGTILPSASEITAIKNAKKITHITLESNREYAIFQFHTFFTWSCDISHSCRLTVISLCTITALGFHTQSLYIRVSTSRTGRWCFCSQWAVVTSSTDDLCCTLRPNRTIITWQTLTYNCYQTWNKIKVHMTSNALNYNKIIVDNWYTSIS